MANPLIKVKRSETASAVPTLTYGELGVNITDKKIFVGNSSNVSTLIVDGNAGGSSTTINATNDIATTTLYPIMVGALGSAQTVKGSSTNSFMYNAVSGSIGLGTTNPFNGTVGATGIDVNRASAQIHARNVGTATECAVWASDENYFSLPSYKGVGIRKYGTTYPGNIFGSIPYADLGALTFQNTTNALINTNGGTPLILATTNLEAMRINSSQNIGMGNTSPSFKADIAGDVRVTSTNKMRFGGTAGTTNFYIQYNSTANSLDFVAG